MTKPLGDAPPDAGIAPREPLREQLAADEHDRWARWMRHLFSKCEWSRAALLIPAHWEQRWRRQVDTSYADLTEDEKDRDRAEADRILALVEGEAEHEIRTLRTQLEAKEQRTNAERGLETVPCPCCRWPMPYQMENRSLICPCCGYEPGFDDMMQGGIDAYRQSWNGQWWSDDDGDEKPAILMAAEAREAALREQLAESEAARDRMREQWNDEVNRQKGYKPMSYAQMNQDEAFRLNLTRARRAESDNAALRSTLIALRDQMRAVIQECREAAATREGWKSDDVWFRANYTGHAEAARQWADALTQAAGLPK